MVLWFFKRKNFEICLKSEIQYKWVLVPVWATSKANSQKECRWDCWECEIRSMSLHSCEWERCIVFLYSAYNSIELCKHLTQVNSVNETETSFALIERTIFLFLRFDSFEHREFRNCVRHSKWMQKWRWYIWDVDDVGCVYDLSHLKTNRLLLIFSFVLFRYESERQPIS